MLINKATSVKKFKEEDIPFYLTETDRYKEFSYANFMEGKKLKTRIDDFIKALGLNPNKLSLYNKLCIITQFIPYVIQNFNIYIVGGKDTFKSSPYTCYSSLPWVYAGIPTTADLRGNKNKPDLPVFYNHPILVCEEVADDKTNDSLSNMKNTMQSKKFINASGINTVLTASIVFIGNVYSKLNCINELGNREIVFSNLANTLIDEAFLDRFNVTIFKDSNFKVSEDSFFTGDALNINALMGSLEEIKPTNYDFSIDNTLFNSPREVGNSKKTVQGLCKILYPECPPCQSIIDGLTIFALHLFLVGKSYSPPFTSQSIPFLIEAYGFNDVDEVTLYENRAIFKIKDDDYSYKVGLTGFGVEENMDELKYFKLLTEKNNYISNINISSSDKFMIRQEYFPVYSLIHSYNRFGGLMKREKTDFKNNIEFNLILIENIKNAVVYNQSIPQHELRAWKEMTENELKKIVSSTFGNCASLNKSDYHYDNKQNFKMINFNKYL